MALFEYIFQVPANRGGSNEWTVPQLKILQECITLAVFIVIAFALFRSPLKWNYCVAYALIVGAVFFAFKFEEGEVEAGSRRKAEITRGDYLACRRG